MKATLRWVPPTHNTDGTPIRGNITYNLYQFSSNPLPTNVIRGIVVPHYTVRNLPRHSTTCFYVRAVVNGQLSSGSNLACTHITT